MTSVTGRSSRMPIKLLPLFAIYAAFSVAAAQTPISIRTTTLLPSTVVVGESTSSSTESSVKLTVSPGITVYSGSPVNFTCKFKTLPKTDNIFFISTSNYLTRTIAQVSTLRMAAVLPTDIRQRMVIYLLNDGVSLQFDYSYTVLTDSGTYRCYIAGGPSSNYVSLTVNYNYGYMQQSTVTMPQPTASFLTTSPMVTSYTNFDYDTQSIGSINIPLVITVTIGVACVITACILIALRLKYRERFCRCKTCPQQPPNCVTTQASRSAHAGGTTNPVYSVDAEQLPSYLDAITLADHFMPPSYNEVVKSSAAPSVPSAPLPEEDPYSIV